MLTFPVTMIRKSNQQLVGTSGFVILSAIAMILVAAATEHDASWERLRAMPPEERTRLLENLRKFDLQLTPEQQSALRDLDGRLSEMDPDRRVQYLSVLRRYHGWLGGLPENRQDELAAKPPGERMALVRKLIRERPVPAADTPPILRVLEPGEYSPFELASAYRIWRVLNENQRARVEQAKQENVRRERLFTIGANLKNAIPRETRPDDFDEDRWIGLAQAQRPNLVPEKAAANNKLDDAVRKREAVRHEILKRQAINLYVSRAEGRPEFRPVAPDRLARFVSALPGWVQTSFDPLPPDEARRRLTVAYRLVFPPPEEIDSKTKPAGAGTKTHAVPTVKPAAPARSKRKAAGTEDGSTPF